MQEIPIVNEDPKKTNHYILDWEPYFPQIQLERHHGIEQYSKCHDESSGTWLGRRLRRRRNEIFCFKFLF